MVHVKTYETVSTFLKFGLCRENCVHFSGHGAWVRVRF